MTHFLPKKHYAILFVLTIGYIVSFGQNIKELTKLENSAEYWEIVDEAEQVVKQDTNGAIKIYEEIMEKTSNSFIKASIMNNLGQLYISTKQFDKYYKICKDLIDSGTSVFFEIRGQTYPRYIDSLKGYDNFDELIEKNKKIIEEKAKNSKAEYYIQKPEQFDKSKTYPLVMIFHGGVGHIQGQQHYWKSEKLKKDYLVAFVQGKNYIGSNFRRFGTTGKSDIKEIYEKIKEDYLIDTTNILLGGPSAGGMLSIDLAINKYINAKGLILVCPVKPRDFGADEILEAGLNGLKASMLCGENDWSIESQKEMSVIFDKLYVKNRIVIFPDKGHEFPDDFEYQILKSLEFFGV